MTSNTGATYSVADLNPFSSFLLDVPHWRLAIQDQGFWTPGSNLIDILVILLNFYRSMIQNISWGYCYALWLSFIYSRCVVKLVYFFRSSWAFFPLNCDFFPYIIYIYIYVCIQFPLCFMISIFIFLEILSQIFNHSHIVCLWDTLSLFSIDWLELLPYTFNLQSSLAILLIINWMMISYIHHTFSCLHRMRSCIFLFVYWSLWRSFVQPDFSLSASWCCKFLSQISSVLIFVSW